MLKRVGMVVVNVGVFAWFLTSSRGFWVYRADLDVYRLGAGVWLAGGELYGTLPELLIGTTMPFTYPPIAAALFSPFAIVPFGVASAGLTVLTIALVAVVVRVVLRSLDVRVSFWLLLPAVLVLEPMRTNFHYGQINVVLMALVVLDCLVRSPKWPRGLLVGIVAAVKLTPAVFVLFFLLRGDRKAAVTATVSFLGMTSLGFLLAPADSARFWTDTVFDTSRVGGATRVANQSIKGLTARVGLDSTVLWVFLATATIALGVLVMRRAIAAGQPTLALCVNALAALPVTPVSWSHHWVWVAPILVTFGVIAWRTRTREAVALAAGGLLLFTFSPHWWGVWHLLTTNLYVCFAAVALWSTHRQLGRTRVDVDHRAVA